MADGPSKPKSRGRMNGDHRTVNVSSARWWRRLFAFVGPAYMVSVGYMDPGNWATDIAGGSQFGYTLLWVLVMSNAMAILLQTLSARLGLVTGRDLAQACRDAYPLPVGMVLFGLTEIAIIATDLAEALGSAIGLNLLFGIPILWAVGITACDVLLLLVIQRFGIRKMEALIVLLISTIGVCFIIELFLGRPEWGGILSGVRPHLLSPGELYVGIGILGATVMPHNLYLHSALVQSRDVPRSIEGVRDACRFNLIDSTIALNAALLVNAAILLVAAANFWTRGIEVTEIQQAHSLLQGLLGTRVAPIVFALALLAAGQSSTVTGTLAGQITMEGFLHFRMRPWLRRLATRLLAVIPAVVVIVLVGERGVYRLLIFSQVVLSLQLPFAVVPLIKFTGSRRKMGRFASRPWLLALAWFVAAVIVALNAWLVWDQVAAWMASAGRLAWLVGSGAIGLSAALGGMLLWMTFRREEGAPAGPIVSADEIVQAARTRTTHLARIGVALEAKPSDAAMLAKAIDLASIHGAELVLMHVVEGVGGQWYGANTGDAERREDEEYLKDLAARLAGELKGTPVAGVRFAIGFGNVPRAISGLARTEKVDLLVLGGHGHRTLGDIVHGETIQRVRHSLSVPILAVRGEG